MSAKHAIVAILLAGEMIAAQAVAQTAPRGPAASQGQERGLSRLPQPASGGRPTGQPAVGAETEQERAADEQAKRSTQICKGC